MTAVVLSTSSDKVAWTAVCHLADLVPERGAAALVGGEQVALFRMHAPADVVLAVQQLDPYSGANVMARGIVGSRGEAPTVASPMYKQVFDLRTGACLDPVGREPVDLRTWPVHVEGGLVLVGSLLGTTPPEATP
ncbi:MAG TPA: nitrite reductase small subunit NirD [Actinotalea sp.]|jgi:nitrite reductase (NADH) small subunit